MSEESERRAEVLRAIAGLGVAASVEEVLLALSGAGAELLLSGSAMVMDGGVVIHARPHGLVGMHVTGIPDEDGVRAVDDLCIDGAPVGPAVVLGLHGHQLAWAGLPEVEPAHLEIARPLAELGRMSLEQVERLQRRHQRVTRKLEGSEATVLALFGGTSDPVWALDRDLRLTAFNPAFVGMMQQGFAISPRYGDRLDLLPEPHRTRHERLYRRVLEHGELRIDWTTPDRSRVFDVSLRPIKVGEESVGVAVYCRDVTESQRAAALLRRAKDDAEQANRAKSAFLAQMSHEIRTPLNAIVGLTDLVLGTGLDAEQRDLLAKVKTNSNALLHLVSGILDFSRIEAGRVEIVEAPMDLATMVVDAVDTLRHHAERKALELTVQVAEGFPARVMGDDQRLRQIVVNLVENALKYTDAGRVSVGLGMEGDAVHLVVSDTGWGIPEAERARIFERFHRGVEGPRDVGGVGLGLAITLDLVQRMNGRIEVESATGQGTSFRVTLPLAVVRWRKEERVDPEGRRLKRALRILVVDDSADNRVVTAALLDRVGHRVVAATSGREALERVAGSGAFDLVLMDVHMPEMDGLDTARAMRASGYAGPIVALTAHATPDVAHQCAEAGMDGFLTKPVRGATLEQEVLRYGRRPRFLVVDPSESAALLRLWLERAGADVAVAADASSALGIEGPLDGVFVDHEIPETRATGLVEALAAAGIAAPIVVVTSRPAERLSGLWPQTTRFLERPVTASVVLDAADALLASPGAPTGALRG